MKETTSEFKEQIKDGSVRSDTEEQQSDNRKYKYTSLVFLTIHNALVVLCMRHVRTRDSALFLTSVAVVLVEIIKIPVCLTIILVQEKNVRNWWRHLYGNLNTPTSWIKISVPATLFIIQNNLVYVAISNLEATTFQITYQLKIITTALWSVVVLGKSLAWQQWASMVFLFIGVAIVQAHNASSHEEDENFSQRHLVGLLCVLIACSMTGFSGVYFEKMLKETKQSIWIRNIQLSVIGTIIAICSLYFNISDIRQNGILYGFDLEVYVVLFLQAIGGLMIAVVIKYADNILKGFATSGSVIISGFVSFYRLNVRFSFWFLFGTSIVLLSLTLYANYSDVPQTKINQSHLVIKSQESNSEKTFIKPNHTSIIMSQSLDFPQVHNTRNVRSFSTS